MIDARQHRTPSRLSPSRCRHLLLLSLLVALVSWTVSCRPDGNAEPQELQTEEVSLPPDALVNPALDVKEKQRVQESLAGQLPSNFPKDLPTFPGATVVDFSESGAPWIEFLAAAPGHEVARRYASLLGAAGWTPAREGLVADGQARTYVSGGGTVSLELETRGPSTRIRIGY